MDIAIGREREIDVLFCFLIWNLTESSQARTLVHRDRDASAHHHYTYSPICLRPSHQDALLRVTSRPPIGFYGSIFSFEMLVGELPNSLIRKNIVQRSELLENLYNGNPLLTP